MKKVIFAIILTLMVAQVAAEEKHNYAHPNIHNRSHSHNNDQARRPIVPNGYQYGYRHQYDHYGYVYPPHSVNRVPNGYYGYPQQPVIRSPYRYDPYCDCFIR